MKINRELAKRVLETVDHGLVAGLGQPILGQMCVEAAVCYAMGMPHGDDPPCVHPAVCSFKIKLNDANWSSDQARAEGLRRVAVAQLGSDTIDGGAFATEVTVQVIKQILPIALRATAAGVPKHKEALEAAAVVCEAATDLASGRVAAKQAQDAATAAYTYAAYICAAEAAYAAASAYAAADAAYAAAAAYATTCAADAAAMAATTAAYATKQARDNVLRKAAEIGVQALIKVGAQGTQFLDLCD